jgi:hypothetical protein
MARRKYHEEELSLAGTDDLGQVRGIHPAIGAAVSVGAGTATAIGVRQFSSLDKYSELIGGGVGISAGVIMMFFPNSRAAGYTGIISALLNNGLRYAAALISDKEKLRDASGALASKTAKTMPIKNRLAAIEADLKAAGTASGTTEGAFGIVRPQVVPTLGAVSARQVPSLGAVSAERRRLADAGLGLVQAEQRQLAAAQLPQFQSHMGMGQAQSPVQIVGAGGIGGNYGATVFGSR